MSYPVTYYCPHCGAFVELRREGYLADKAVTPFPFEGWAYAAPDEAFEDADGVAFACGESAAPGLSWRPSDWDPREETGDEVDEVGCGESFYLSFVRFADGEELDPRKPSEYVDIDP